MTTNEAAPPRSVPTWFLLAVAIVALVVASVALTATLVRGPGAWWGMMAGSGTVAGPGMMVGRAGGQGADAPAPGQPGFVAGTASTPRVVHIWAGPGYAFSPSTIAVARGETLTFEVTVMGPTSHEFMVGPADAVAGDVAGTPEIDGLGMMQTRSLTYTFDGPGPYAFACHAPGHYEAGMRGTITVVP
ncbi:MAG TPA: plastocyanin/azurin family copper-binding protein [Candidatus Limnocylindrales bacterium]|nr:plastocyanin/azurin family copper-binding protein [Candidatus Limnocylindrales bacterium]